MAEIETRSNEILTNLTEGLDFSIPNVDFNDSAFDIPSELADALKKVPSPLTLEGLTERRVDGCGAFDVVMTSLKKHLEVEYDANRITGAEYAKAYTSCMQFALQFSVEYLLGKDTAYYQSLGTMAQSITANISAYTAKVQLAIAQAQAHQQKAQYAASVLQLASIEKQTGLVEAQTVTQEKQQTLLHEQAEQAHSQVSDTTLAGNPVTGYTGNQNNLLKQQVVNFKNDTVLKGAKIYVDSFANQLSMSTATVAGTGLDAANIGDITAKLKTVVTTGS